MFKISPAIRHRLALDLRPPIARRESFSFICVGKPFSISGQIEAAFRMKDELEGGPRHAHVTQSNQTDRLVALPTAATSNSVGGAA